MMHGTNVKIKLTITVHMHVS